MNSTEGLGFADARILMQNHTMIYGYARVLTAAQDVTTQRAQLVSPQQALARSFNVRRHTIARRPPAETDLG